jgi:cytochrome c oxidase subunit II
MPQTTIRNPLEWLGDELQDLAHGLGLAGRSMRRTSTHLFTPPMAIHRIGVHDLKEALTKGFDDFGAYRTDLLFLILVYPLACIVIATVAFQQELIPLLFPLVSGSAILGPFVGVFLYELSRRRELNFQRHHEDNHSWSNALSILRSRNFGAIMALGLILVVLYALWMALAWVIFKATQGPQPMQSIGSFIQGLFLTEAGWWLIALGCGVGFLFAVLALMIGVVSFPLLLDREVGLGTAVGTSIRAALTNPVPLAIWGLIVVAGLVLGAVPALIGLVVVMPVLCHATWHLYRKLVPRQYVPHGHKSLTQPAPLPQRAMRLPADSMEDEEGDEEQGVNVVLLLLVTAIGSVVFHLLSPWWWTPIASNWEYIDHTITITFWITGVVFTAVVLFVAYCVYRFHHRPGRRAAYEPENKSLETWLTVVTGLGVAAMLAPGLVVWHQFVTVPDDATEMEVVGQQWAWSYRFPGADGKLGTFDTRNITAENPFGLNQLDQNGQDDVLVQNEDLHVPLGKPIKVLMRSTDVLHDFYVPEFRAKMDMIPGMVTYFWFTPTREGTFDILCAELCGQGHAYMRGKVVVVPEAEFQAWLGTHTTFAQSSAPAEQQAAK